MAYITVYNETYDSFFVRLDGLDTNYSYVGRRITWEVDGQEKTDTLLPFVSSSDPVVFTGLEPGRWYSIYCYVSLPTGGGVEFTGSGTTLDRPSVEKWDWFASTARQRAYSAVTGRGLLSNFSYVVWNEMVDKVLEVAQSKGYTWWIDPMSNLSYSETRMSAYDKEMTAARFNSLRYNIGAHYQQNLVPVVYRGNPIYGRYFTDVMAILNWWIDS